MSQLHQANLAENAITRTGVIEVLQSKVNRLIADSPFFSGWTPAFVTRPIADRFLGTFNNLVGCFPPIIALATSRLGEVARVVLAKNLFEECGEGDPRRTHHAIYRNFLSSVGLNPEVTGMDEHTDRWKTFLWSYVTSSGSPESVGAIAAGEVLAHPALTRIFEPLQGLYPGADIEYFTTHLAQEVEHVNELADLITAECNDERSFTRLTDGFDQGLLNWDYWFRAMARRCLEGSREGEGRSVDQSVRSN